MGLETVQVGKEKNRKRGYGAGESFILSHWLAYL